MQKYLVIVVITSSLLPILDAFIVPQEIPSLLSLVYSNIPPIKKGTDSRIGFGYRLGDHADFQVQFELGPQKETKAIGTGSTNKRNVDPIDEFKEKKLADRKKVKQQGGSWLQNWFTGMKRDQFAETTEKAIEYQSQISQDALSQLQQLYKKSDNEATETEENQENVKS